PASAASSTAPVVTPSHSTDARRGDGNAPPPPSARVNGGIRRTDSVSESTSESKSETSTRPGNCTGRGRWSGGIPQSPRPRRRTDSARDSAQRRTGGGGTTARKPRRNPAPRRVDSASPSRSPSTAPLRLLSPGPAGASAGG